MQLSQQQPESSHAAPNFPQQRRLTPLTRREFYQLAERCREYALELARYDQTRVDLAQCHKFNSWLLQLKMYDLLEPVLRTLKPARPVARWQVLSIAAVAGFILLVTFASRFARGWQSGFFYSYLLLLVVVFLIPERIYGTTIELLEGKVLRIVDAMDTLLSKGELGFSEAAHFQAKGNLESARRELRQQIDLAHR